MRFTFAMTVLFVSTFAAKAGCEFAVGPCSTDSLGNTYHTEQNLGGGYNTYKNGSLYSQTEQTLNGGYTESYTSGGSRTHNMNPYQAGKSPWSND